VRVAGAIAATAPRTATAPASRARLNVSFDM
jgi:hypothetical protein